MTNREYIDQLNTYIKSSFNKEKSEKGFVDNNFFKSEDLKSKIKLTLDTLVSIGTFPEINTEKFNEFYATAIKESKYKNQLGMTPRSISLESEESKQNLWLTMEKQDKLGWNSDELDTYRMRYMHYLKDIGRSEDYIKETKRSSLAIVKKFGNPNAEHHFYTRGLVVGSVQSGKTANFNAVINSSIDMGYGLIIVLSGIMEDLRKQTQKRIEKEVEGKYIGQKDGKSIFIGVGGVSSFGIAGDYKDVHQIILPTSIETDFKKNMKEADFSLNNKNILVCKKNTSVLKNLLLWLDEYLNENKDKIKIPFLIIDDEADNASLNNLGSKGVEYASTINGHIRALLALFDKKTYLGYTATPSGNVLQDRNKKPAVKWTFQDKSETKEFDQESSLFPHDFIELLFPPSNYIGAKHFFETQLDEVKKIDLLIPPAVNDYLDIFPSRVFEDTLYPTTMTGKGTRATKKEDPFPPEGSLPNSLEDAIRCFILSIAIRISREKEMKDSKLFQPHNTMLIHISRFTTWQIKTSKSVQKYVDSLEFALNNDNPKSVKSIYSEFERTWYKYYAEIMENIKGYLSEEYDDPYLTPKTFNKDIKKLLISAISDIEVKAVNSEKKDSLVYSDDNPKKYIAIGGNRLSRGFTLEGLTINYFIRNTNFSDTLLQMGRWFGYRPGYVDCCKVFATKEALDKFDQTSLTIEDLEQKFMDMNREGKTPDEYSLKVLKHPGVLKITRPSILKNTKEVNWSYSDHLIQTAKFHINKEKIEKAWEGFTSHILTIQNKFKTNNDYLEYRTNNPSDLFSFLRLPNSFYTLSEQESENYFSTLESYIKLCNEKNKLQQWSIIIKIANSGSEILPKESNLPILIKKTVRSGFKPDSRWFKELLENKMFSSTGKFGYLLSGSKSGDDMKIRLDKSQVTVAIKEFQKELFQSMKKKNPTLSDIEIEAKVQKTAIPERVFRKKMSEEEGVLVIYLLDLAEIFKYKKKDVEELSQLKNSVNTSTPLIGYVIGIPPVDESIGGNYLESKYYNEKEDISELDVFEDVIEDVE